MYTEAFNFTSNLLSPRLGTGEVKVPTVSTASSAITKLETVTIKEINQFLQNDPQVRLQIKQPGYTWPCYVSLRRMLLDPEYHPVTAPVAKISPHDLSEGEFLLRRNSCRYPWSIWLVLHSMHHRSVQHQIREDSYVIVLPNL